MGRVYTVNPDVSKGERSGNGFRLYTVNLTNYINCAFRVEFDQDTDDGMATVTAYATDNTGKPLVDQPAGRGCKITFRTFCRMRKNDGSVKPEPNAMVWRGDDGQIRVHSDPVPSVEFTELKQEPELAVA